MRPAGGSPARAAELRAAVAGQGPRPPPRIEIDLNVRTGRDLTYSGFGDIAPGWTAMDLPPGSGVEVCERESGVSGPAVVAGRDFRRELIYLRVDWQALSGDCRHGCNGDEVFHGC